MSNGNKNFSRPYAERQQQSSFEFVTHTLSKAEKEDFNSWWEATSADTFTLLDEMALDGYKVTVNWDERNSCYSCFITGTGSSCPNYGFILSGRSDNTMEALGIALYKHIALFKRGKWPEKDSTSRWG